MKSLKVIFTRLVLLMKNELLRLLLLVYLSPTIMVTLNHDVPWKNCFNVVHHQDYKYISMQAEGFAISKNNCRQIFNKD